MSDPGPGAADGTTSEYRVSGMTCQHCVVSVTQRLSAVDTVRTVAVDLGSGRVTVVSDGPLDEAVVSAAIADAGYALVDR